MNRSNVEIFVCKRCNLLLFRLNETYEKERLSVLNRYGLYNEDDSEDDGCNENLIQQTCPSCDGSSYGNEIAEGSNGNNRGGKTLKLISLDEKSFNVIYNFWCRIVSEDREKFFVGIPIDSQQIADHLTAQKIKEIILEHGI